MAKKALPKSAELKKSSKISKKIIQKRSTKIKSTTYLKGLKIEVPKHSKKLTKAELKGLVRLICKEYKISEAGMWKPDYKRTSEMELTATLDNQKLMIARYKGKIVGSLVLELDEKAKTGGFGMLVVD